MSMSINSLNCSNIRFGSTKKPEKKSQPNETISKVPLPGTKRLNYSPVTIGALNGFCWFGVGMIMDKLATKIFNSKGSTKLSLALQGAFGLFMGYQAYKVAKNESKQA